MFAAPGRSHLVAAAFVDLTPIGSELVSLFGAGQPVELLVLGSDGRTVLTRSIDPASSIGRSVAGTRFARAGNATERVDLNGTERLYAVSRIPGTSWRLYVGSDAHAADAAAGQLAHGQLVIILVGLALSLLAILIVYHRVARPIERLSRVVSMHQTDDGSTPGAGQPPSEMPGTGPAQVRALAAAIDGLIAAGERELSERAAAEHAAREAEAVARDAELAARDAELAARDAERSYRMLFEGSPLPAFVYDAETLAIIQVNDAAVARYGYSRDESESLTIDDLEVDGESRTTDVEQDRLTRHRKKDGGEIEVQLTTHATRFGDRDALVVVAEDVGERERLTRQLRQSQRLESLGQLAGGVAHDFNNLLGAIMGYTSLIKQQLESGADAGHDPQLVHDIGQVDQAAGRAARLTRQLLLFSRREISQATLVDVPEVIRGLEEFLARSLGEHIKLTIAVGDVARVEIDPGQLEQVVTNLAINARDAMPDGGELTIDAENVTIDAEYVSSRPGIPTGNYVRVRVSDTGEGMDAATLDRAFEPFFTTKPKGEGTGLGLASVYGIVTQAGGRVRIYSEPGHGTTLSVLLPIAPDRVPDAPLPEPAEQSHGGSETILLVEDEPALREVTARMLKRNGYRVLIAADGAAAVEIASGHEGEIALLLTDVVMPNMLGREVAAEVSQLRPGIGVLYISGYAQPVLGAQGTLEPGVALLEKPFTEPGLLKKIREVLKARAASA